MSNGSGGEKTEPPTPKRIKDARKEGNFLFSREIVQGVILVMVLAVLIGAWSFFLSKLLATLLVAFEVIPLSMREALSSLLPVLFAFFATTVGLVYLLSVLGGVAANVVQVGLVFSFAKIAKGFQSLNFINNAKQTFAKKNLFTFLMNVVKLVVIGLISGYLVWSWLPDLVRSVRCGYVCAIRAGALMVVLLFVFTALAQVFVAAIDYIFQRRFYLADLRMSIDEVKREYKESEGDPHIKGQRRQQHQEILASDAIENVSNSSVVVKNPAHYAVALYYDEDKTPLPIVTAKGEGTLARRMLQAAERFDIPVFENVALAQNLFFDSTVSHYVPREWIRPVAEILATLVELREQTRL